MSELDVERAMQQAVSLHQAGDIAGAEKIYRQVLTVAPSDGDALHLLGVITLNTGRASEAVELLRRAVAAQPDVPEFHLDLGRSLLAMHQPQDAAMALERATQLDERLADPWFLLGKVQAALGLGQQAAASLRKTVELLPDHPEAHRELADVLMMLPDFEAAVAEAQAVMRLRPDDPAAAFGLGNALRAAVRYADAVDAYRRALAIKPDYVEAMLHLASVLWTIAPGEEPVELCRAAVKLRPDFAMGHYALGMALEKTGRHADAAESYRQALRLDPMQATWKFDLAAVSGQSADAPPTEFVIRLFDEYAPRFEQHLVEQLQYRAPEQLFELLKPHVGDRRDLDVMDIGCGTGLCGKLFRPLARSMAGVDLSPRMIEISRQTGLYDRLITAEAADCLLAQSPQSLDLIVAADVLIYVGEPTRLFAAAHQALRPGGWFALSIESQAEDGFSLKPTRRYTHSPSYIDRAAHAAGLARVDARPVTLRIQGKAPVAGMVVLLQKT